MSRQKVSVKAGTSWDFGKTNTFQLNRFGILAGLVLKLSVADSGSAGKPGLNFGNMTVKRAALTSHSREVEQCLDVGNLSTVLEMPIGAKQNLMDLALNDDPVAGTFAGSKSVYVPLNFSFCRNGLSMALDLSFVEQIECEIELAPLVDVAEVTTNVTLDAANCELLCYYYNLSEADLRRYEDAEFSLEKPLSVMGCSNYRENAVTIASASGSQETVTMTFNCPNVVTKTMIYCDDTSSSGNVVGNFQPIDKIEYFMSGRLVWSSSGEEMQKLENSLFYGSSYGAGEVAGGSSPDQAQNIYTHHWGVSNEANRFSGGCSGKNISDWSAKIYFTGTSSKAYRFQAVHEYVNIVSISGASGKIGVSLSL